MSADARKLWPLVVALGACFALLNVSRLIFLESGAPEVVGVGIGIVAMLLGVAMARGRPERSA